MVQAFLKMKQVAVLAFAIVSATSVLADIQPVTQLSFGKVAVSGSAMSQEIIVSESGNVRYNGVYPLEPANRGVFQLSRFPANQVLTISVQALPSSQDNPFTLSNVNTQTYISTDANGEATIYIGGTLTVNNIAAANASALASYDTHYQINISY